MGNEEEGFALCGEKVKKNNYLSTNLLFSPPTEGLISPIFFIFF
jgi:hypothetical protein